MRDGYRIIDAGRHLMEPPTLWEDYLEAKYRHRAPMQIGRWSASWLVDGIANDTAIPPPNGNGGFHAYSRAELMRLPAGFWTRPAWRKAFYQAIEDDFRPASYLADMDRSGVDVAICFGSSLPYFGWRDELDLNYLTALCRAYNDWVHDYVSDAAGRLFGIAALPLHDPKAAAREAVRAVEQLGLVGFLVRPNPLLGRSWHDREYEYFYAVVEELGRPLCFHEGSPSTMRQARLPYGSSAFVRHAMTHPFEQMLACLSMVGMGAFERHPRLKAVFVRAGCGWVPFWLDRLDRLFEDPALGSDAPIERKPSFYFQRQASVTCGAGTGSLASFHRRLGTDTVLWASDYPHPDETLRFPDSVGPLIGGAEIPVEAAARILWENPNRFFGLGLD